MSFFISSRRRHTRLQGDWSSDVCSSDLSIDTGRKVVMLDGGPIAYDLLVLATGATHGYFGHDEWAAHAPGLKTLDDAIGIRRRILLAFERAEMTSNPAECARLLTIAIVGGGPTGVELAGAVAELSRRALARDFRAIDPTRTRVILIEAGPRLLATFPERRAGCPAGPRR